MPLPLILLTVIHIFLGGIGDWGCQVGRGAYGIAWLVVRFGQLQAVDLQTVEPAIRAGAWENLSHLTDCVALGYAK